MQPTVTASVEAARIPVATTVRAEEAMVAISPVIRSSADAWLRSWSTSVSSTQTPSVPMIAAGAWSAPATSRATSATAPPRKASAMP